MIVWIFIDSIFIQPVECSKNVKKEMFEEVNTINKFPDAIDFDYDKFDC